MKKYKYYIQMLVFTIFVFAAYADSAFGQSINYKIELINNKLSICAQEVPLGSLLKEIEDRTGIQFIIGEEESKKIFSGNFKSLPMEEAFGSIFQNIDHVIFYNSDGKIGKVIVTRTVAKNTPPAKSNTENKKLQRENKTPSPHGSDDMNVTYEPDTMEVF